MGCGSTNMDDLRSGVNFLSSLPLSISILAQGLENGMIMLLRQAEIFCQQYKRIFFFPVPSQINPKKQCILCNTDISHWEMLFLAFPHQL